MRKILTAAVISVLGFALVVPTTFAANTIGGNGAGSITGITSTGFTLASKTQTNTSLFENNLSVKSKVWGQANFNTGGSTTLLLGSANNTANVSNVAGSNTSNSSDVACCCNQLPTDNSIVGNGANSISSINQSTKCITKLNQTNVTQISNNIDASSKTGGSANFNTGSDVTVGSGDATTSVTVTNVAGSNTSL